MLNSVIHKRKYKGEYPNHFIKENRIINNINEIVNEFNDYFVKIGYNLANKIVHSQNKYINIDSTHKSSN